MLENECRRRGREAGYVTERNRGPNAERQKSATAEERAQRHMHRHGKLFRSISAVTTGTLVSQLCSPVARKGNIYGALVRRCDAGPRQQTAGDSKPAPNRGHTASQHCSYRTPDATREAHVLAAATSSDRGRLQKCQQTALPPRQRASDPDSAQTYRSIRRRCANA